MRFRDLGLSGDILRAVEDSGYVEPTPIQSEAIPAALAGRDVLGIAQTGTGKTAAFTLPILTALAHGRARARMPRSLVLCPTRELAAQVAASFENYGKNFKLHMALLIGGVSFAEQNARIDRGSDVLVATPGRLLDHFERGKLMLSGVQILVIDEADRMLDMGFIPDVERICRLIPFTRQTMLFSATMPGEIARLADEFMQGAVRIEVAPPATTVEGVRQLAIPVKGAARSRRHDRLNALVRALQQPESKIASAIVFCNRKTTVRSLHEAIARSGISAAALHGDMDQHQRMATLDAFRSSETTLLVASDVAARGLDIPAVSHVFNYEVPLAPEDYVHRIGRTARAGRSGVAITLFEESERRSLAQIERRIGTSFEILESAAESEDGPRDRPPGRGISGSRASKENTAGGPEDLQDSTVPGSAPGADRRRRKPRRRERTEGIEQKESGPLTFGDSAPAFLLQGLETPRTKQRKPR